MNLKLVIPVIAIAAVPAAAQPVEHPAEAHVVPGETPSTASLTLAVDVAATGTVDADEVRAALAAELGVTIVAGDAYAPSLGRLAIEVAAGALRVTYQPVSGDRVGREVALPAAHADQIQLIGFVATNLVRDQVTALLAELAATPSPPSARIVIPPAPTPIVAATPRPPAREHLIPATLGFIPPFATDRIAGAEVSVGLGVHAVMGMTDRSRVASISGVADVQRRTADGLQVGGVIAIAGEEVRGAQIGGAATLARRLRGLQVGGAAAVSGRTDGIQIAGAVTVAGPMRGLQVAGAVAVAERVQGIQVGGAAAAAESVDGLQVAGAVNLAGDVRGAQIGVINIARRPRGLQLGVINVSDDGDDAYPIGLLNFSRNGRVEVDGWVESSRLSAVALRHGPRHVHNLIALGQTPDHDHVLAGFGLGLRRDLTRDAHPWTLDLDAVAWWTNMWDGKLAQLDQLRLTVAVPVGAVDVFAGAAANVYVTDEMDESANFHPVMARRATSDGGVHVVTWPSVFAGVRVHAR